MTETTQATPRIRNGSRLVILNQRNELLMFRHRAPNRSYWILPGGGLEPGETWEAAAIREMWEETGISGVELGPCVWTLDRYAHWFDPPYHSRQRFFLVRVEADDISNANQFDYEREVYVETRWWLHAALAASTDTHYPDGLASAVLPLIRGDIPAEPIELPDSGQE